MFVNENKTAIWRDKVNVLLQSGELRHKKVNVLLQGSEHDVEKRRPLWKLTKVHAKTKISAPWQESAMSLCGGFCVLSSDHL